MFVWIENTALALWVSTSLWAYPFFLCAHISGLAIVVGIFTVRDFHLIGIISGLQETKFLELRKLAYCGFIINSLSGLMLFTSQASYFVTNAPFLSKLLFISFGIILALQIHKRIREKQDHRIIKRLAICSSICWFSAIISGRLIAYIFT